MIVIAEQEQEERVSSIRSARAGKPANSEPRLMRVIFPHLPHPRSTQLPLPPTRMWARSRWIVVGKEGWPWRGGPNRLFYFMTRVYHAAAVVYLSRQAIATRSLSTSPSCSPSPSHRPPTEEGPEMGSPTRPWTPATNAAAHSPPSLANAGQRRGFSLWRWPHRDPPARA
ncbi:hypothetical protein CVT26_011292 [Gymnopilus dilepis]|uniref:Uncharacterized protein n=1 Tax=Gymnopilus dilepis TaxID=231916 RepID=A0A409VJK4_9AGAR|nr:hypothetical protein CVT26_011292 [Gymnopilus dilepis]